MKDNSTCLINAMMTQEKVISWIFLAIAVASAVEPTDIRGISMVADGINHAVPTQKELQLSIRWLLERGLILKQHSKYQLSANGKLKKDLASRNTTALLNIWGNLEALLK